MMSPPHVVGVVALHVADVADVTGDDPVAEARCEALDLLLDLDRRVTGPTRGDVGVGVHGEEAPARARLIRDVLLTEKDERPVRHLAAVDVALAGCDLLVPATDVHGAGAMRRLVLPGDASLHREVDLERRRTMPEASERARDPAWHPLSRDANGCCRCDVQHHDVGLLELVERLHLSIRLEVRAVF